jgi:hypothetical protein
MDFKMLKKPQEYLIIVKICIKVMLNFCLNLEDIDTDF